MSSTSLIGHRLGQYQVVSELGRGQHSTVYQAWQPSLERSVALKVLRRHDRETLLKFQAEARLIAQLVQQGVPNLRQVYEVGQTTDGHIFVVMEYVEDSLRSILRRSRQIGRRMNPVAATNLLQPIALALDAIHKLGWVHLDIKPQNILVSKDGRALLADFGIALRTGAKTRACTPTNASPEQAAGNRPVGPWSDIYSLGTVLYEMVAGHPPVRGDHDIVLLNQHLETVPPSPRRVNALLTASQERAIYRALAKRPKDRFQTAGALIEAMVSTETFLTSVIHTPSAIRNTTTGWLRRLPRLLLFGALLLLIVIVIVVVVGWALASQPVLAPSRPSSTATVEVIAPTATILPSATTMKRMVATKTPTYTVEPTVTLAPASSATQKPRPTSTRTSP